MAKRSNVFQRLIKYIHEQIEPAGGIITESAYIAEGNISKPIMREVDVLIEREINSKQTRIAVECRDRSSKDDIKWIDELIGKYLYLPVHRVIAVSNSGFSKAAVMKALANDIELRTLDEAMSTEWPEEFTKLGIVLISRSFEVETLKINFRPPILKKPTLIQAIYKEGKEFGKIKDLLDICTGDRVREQVLGYLNKHMLEIFKTRADLKKDVLIEDTIPIGNLYIVSPKKNVHNIQSMTIIIRGTAQAKDIPVSYHDYEKARITKGVINIEGLDKVHTIYTVQVAGSKKGKAFVDTRKRNVSK